MNNDNVVFKLAQSKVCSPRFIASADLHLGHKLYNIPELEEDLRDNFVRLCDLAITKKVEYLVIAGDLFEDNLPKPTTISLIKEQVDRLAGEGITLLGIAGDHDKPIQGESWCRVSGIQPVTRCPEFTGFDYYDYSSGMEHVMQLLREGNDPEKVQWIFLHCQFPQLFQFAEDKKKIDFSQVELFKTFPKLQGIIAGDIHAGPEGELVEKNNTAYIGYCGSLGITDISEAAHDHGVLYCDGSHLYRIPFLQRRAYVRINFKGDSFKSFHPELFVTQYKDALYRPIFSVDWDTDSEPALPKLKPLYNIGFVRLSQTIRSMKTGQEEVIVNVRSEMKTEEKIESALKQCCKGDQEIYSLLSEALVATDPKVTLDTFKQKAMS